jgi:hypothetical protein
LIVSASKSIVCGTHGIAQQGHGSTGKSQKELWVAELSIEFDNSKLAAGLTQDGRQPESFQQDEGPLSTSALSIVERLSKYSRNPPVVHLVRRRLDGVEIESGELPELKLQTFREKTLKY